jgi:hypothetical protein
MHLRISQIAPSDMQALKQSELVRFIACYGRYRISIGKPTGRKRPNMLGYLAVRVRREEYDYLPEEKEWCWVNLKEYMLINGSFAISRLGHTLRTYSTLSTCFLSSQNLISHCITNSPLHIILCSHHTLTNTIPPSNSLGVEARSQPLDHGRSTPNSGHEAPYPEMGLHCCRSLTKKFQVEDFQANSIRWCRC